MTTPTGKVYSHGDGGVVWDPDTGEGKRPTFADLDKPTYEDPYAAGKVSTVDTSKMLEAPGVESKWLGYDPEAKADAARGQGWPNSGAHNVTASVQTNRQRIQRHPAFRLSPPNLPRLNMRCGRS